MISWSDCTTSLVLASGYYQVPWTEDSQSKTVFIMPDGHYEFTQMPFRLVNAPADFQRIVSIVLGPLTNTIVMAYMDNLLTPAGILAKGLETLREQW